MSSTPAPATVDQQAVFVVAHYGDTYGLPGVILSTRTSHGRGHPRARALPPGTDAGLAYPRREVSVVDGSDFTPPAGRYLAFCGRCYSHAPRESQAAERVTVRVVVGRLANLFVAPEATIDATATEVR